MKKEINSEQLHKSGQDSLTRRPISQKVPESIQAQLNSATSSEYLQMTPSADPNVMTFNLTRSRDSKKEKQQTVRNSNKLFNSDDDYSSDEAEFNDYMDRNVKHRSKGTFDDDVRNPRSSNSFDDGNN